MIAPFSFLNHQESGPKPGMFIVCGTGGDIARTFDRGGTWSFSNLGSGNLNKIAYGNGVWVIAGNGRMLRSPNNGVNWSVTTITGDWRDVTFIPEISRFVAIRDGSNQFAYSDDLGQTWTTGTVATSRSWEGIAYGNGTLLAVALNTSGTNHNYSTDYGTTWVASSYNSIGGWDNINWLNDRFVGTWTAGANKAAYSQNGITGWTIIPTGNVATRGSAFFDFPLGVNVARYICASQIITGSANGSTGWIGYGNVPTATTNGYYDAAGGDGCIICVGLSGTNRTARTVNGINWSAAASIASMVPTGIAFGEVV